MTKSNRTKTAAAAVVCACIGWGAFAQDVSKIVATINGDPRFEMGFNWQVSDDDAVQSLEIIEGSCADNDTQDECFSAPAFTVPAVVTLYADPEYYAAKANAAGLTPGTLYSYRAGSAAGGWSPTGTFRTAPDGVADFSFIYTADPQGNSEAQFKLAGRAADHIAEELKNNEHAFWLMGGDHVDAHDVPANDRAARGERWDHYFQYQQDAFLRVPYAPVVGNHDIPGFSNTSATTYGTTYFYERMFNMELNADRSGTRKLDPAPPQDGSVYSFAYGNALFFALNFENGYNNYSGVKAWMEAEIDRHEAARGRKFRWRVVVSHRGTYTGGSNHHENPNLPPSMVEIRKNMAPIYQELEIDIGFHGHNHVYEVIGPVIIDDPAEYAASGTGHRVDIDRDVSNRAVVESSVSASGYAGGTYDVSEGTIYFSNSKSGAKTYNTITAPTNKYFELFTGKYANSGTSNGVYSIVDVTANEITIRSYATTVGGEPSLYDEFRVTKIDGYTGTGGGGKSARFRKSMNGGRVSIVRNGLRINAVDKAVIKIYGLDGRESYFVFERYARRRIHGKGIDRWSGKDATGVGEVMC